MSRELARRGSAGRRVEQLPAEYWTLLTRVRWPGRPDRLVDEVLVGPSGVHVVLHRPGRPTSTETNSSSEGADLEEAAVHAGDAAVAVAALLPHRYRRVVTPAVCLTDTDEVGYSVGDVFAASPGVLRHSWRHGPRVLSTSEADAIADHLRAHLEKFPVESRSAAATWWRWRRLWLAGVLTTTTGVGAALAVGVAESWALP